MSTLDEFAATRPKRTRCSVCNSPRKAEIEKELAARKHAVAVIAAWLRSEGEQISYAGLLGHRDNHVGT